MTSCLERNHRVVVCADQCSRRYDDEPEVAFLTLMRSTDYRMLLSLLPESSTQWSEINRTLRNLEPRVEKQWKEEMGEMMGKLKELGNTVLGSPHNTSPWGAIRRNPTGNFGHSAVTAVTVSAPFILLGSTVPRFYGFSSHKHTQLFSTPMQEEYDLLDCDYPLSFVSGSSNEPFTRLPLIPRDTLSKCIQRFQERILKGYRTKAATFGSSRTIMSVGVPAVVDQPFQVEDVTPAELAKLKGRFAVRLINRELVLDALHSDELNDHNQAVLEFFLSVQEGADKKLESSQCPTHGPRIRCRLRPRPAFSNPAGVPPVIHVKLLLKMEDGNPFYVILVVSAPIFPHFKGLKPLGVTRAKNQKGK